MRPPTGRVGDARRLADAARAELEKYGERWNEPTVLMGEAAVALAAGYPDEAAELRACAADVATAQGAHGFADRARRHAGYGDPERQSPGASLEAGTPGFS